MYASVVPSTFVGICDWAYVALDPSAPDWTRSYLMLYKNPAWMVEEDTVYPVNFRIQGFVKSCDLSPLGCWNG